MSNRLQSGRAGEIQAEQWFHNHGWCMVRTQPPVTILGILGGPMIAMLKRYFPRLSFFGHMVIARMGKGGVPDYTGYEDVFLRRWDDTLRQWVKDNSGASTPVYRACEVKEACEDTMPASRLDKSQREFMAALQIECAWVGILWDDGQFSMHPFTAKGSYKKPGQAVGPSEPVRTVHG
jgi:hypothetical protein